MGKKSKYFFLIILMVIGLASAVFQYLRTFQSEIASAYQSAKPAAGHNWSEMQCTSDLCVDATNHRVGIGTDTPGEALEVSGDGLFTGDVCNGGGKCLSSVFQTNVLIGSNPTCPTGQSMIMKAYNGTWYTADNASITSWNKITCGAFLSTDGTSLLVNNTHTSKNCTDASGTVVSAGADSFCRFSGASCPSGWTQFGGWSTTSPETVFCTAYAYCGGGGPIGNCSVSCNPGVHSWSDNGDIERCTGYCVACGWCGRGNSCSYVSCNAVASRTQIGCY